MLLIEYNKVCLQVGISFLLFGECISLVEIMKDEYPCSIVLSSIEHNKHVSHNAAFLTALTRGRIKGVYFGQSPGSLEKIQLNPAVSTFYLMNILHEQRNA